MPEPLFTEQINLMATPGLQAAIRDAAHSEGQTASEFIRQAIRVQLRRVDTEPQPAAAD